MNDLVERVACPRCGSHHHDQPNPRSEFALILLRAFNNVPPDWTPPASWGCYPNDWCSAAWERVVQAAMAETRRIDAEALLVEAQKARDNLYVESSNELRGVANWLLTRGGAA